MTTAATTKTTIVHPVAPSFRGAVALGLFFATIKLVLHIATNLWEAHIGYGYFRDELYYLICGRHLAWGYVDHGPIVALQAYLAETIFGRSLAGIRMLSAFAGAIRVLLTGLLAWSLGGRRPAQALAMIGILLVPQYLGIDSYLSMNSFESIFWMTCLLSVIMVLRGSNETHSWLIFGISAGIGLLNKPSMTFFLLALLLALLFTAQRHILFNRWTVLGIVILVLIAFPNLLWQHRNHWPTLEFLQNGRIHNKNIKLGPLPFLWQQIQNLQPLTIFLWVPGLIWLLRRKDQRWLGCVYLIFLAIMMAFYAKDYYVTPIYPVLFAAGGVAWENQFASKLSVVHNRFFAFPVYESVLVFTGLLLMPMAIPVLKPDVWLAYAKTMHLYNRSSNTETDSSGVLPQFYADRFGWQEDVDTVAGIYRSLSPADQNKVGILCSNYGEASALNFLGKGLPNAVSGHNNYWIWGPSLYTGDVMIVISGSSPEEMRKFYDSVETVGRMDHPLSMPFEHRNIYLARGRKKNLSSDWKSLKFYF